MEAIRDEETKVTEHFPPGPALDPNAPVILEVVDHVATVTLNRPHALNALNPEMIVRLLGVWQHVRDTADIHVVILTGAGDRAFCAGADLKRLVPLMIGVRAPEDEWDEIVLRNPRTIEDAMLRELDIDRPIVAAINGLAMGGGLEMIQATDIRLACSDAVFSLPEVTRGLFPVGGSTVNMPAQMPFAPSMELLLTGQPFGADRALALNFINSVHPRAVLLQAAREIARTIASHSSVAVRAIRRSVRATADLPRSLALAKEREIAKSVFDSDAARAGVARFASIPS